MLGLDDGVAEPVALGVADGLGVGVDSTGRLVVALGFGVAVLLVARGDGVPAGRAAANRSLPVAARSRRGSASMTARAFGDASVGSGDGLGRTAAAVPLPRSGNGRVALVLTGPPARVTLTSPP